MGCWAASEECCLEDGSFDYAYIPSCSTFRDLRPETVHRFLFGSKPERPVEMSKVLLEYARTKRFIVFDNFLSGLSHEFVNDVLCTIRDYEKYALIITSDFYLMLRHSTNLEQVLVAKNATFARDIKDELSAIKTKQENHEVAN